MNKTDLITKYDHCLTLNNYSNRTLCSYLNESHIFLDYGMLIRSKKNTQNSRNLFITACKKVELPLFDDKAAVGLS